MTAMHASLLAISEQNRVDGLPFEGVSAHRQIKVRSNIAPIRESVIARASWMAVSSRGQTNFLAASQLQSPLK